MSSSHYAAGATTAAEVTFSAYVFSDAVLLLLMDLVLLATFHGHVTALPVSLAYVCRLCTTAALHWHVPVLPVDQHSSIGLAQLPRSTRRAMCLLCGASIIA